MNTYSHEELLKIIQQQNSLLKEQASKIEELLNVVAMLKEENQQLRDEIARLKGQKSKPRIPPSTLEGRNANDKQKGKRGRYPRQSKTKKMIIHQKQRIKPEFIPTGAVFKGINPLVVQDIHIQSYNILYELERWQLPNGTYITGKIPENVQGHFGPELITYILHQYHHCCVTEPLLLEQLHQYGVKISSGQLNNILIHKKEAFHKEKQELLMAGIEANGYIQTDDTGARHQGKNGYCTIIGNELFSFFQTTDSKSRVNFLQILRGGHTDYVINQEALIYLETNNAPEHLKSNLRINFGEKFLNEETWQNFLTSLRITRDLEVRLITEAALIGSLIEHGIPKDLGVLSDDAGQFDVFVHFLCWIHEERHLRKIIPYNEDNRQEIAEIRNRLWEFYRDLKEYKTNPSEGKKQTLEEGFKKLFTSETSSCLVNDRLKKIYNKKVELLRVLERPEVPLHNNGMEKGIREQVKKRKISGGTKSDEGKKCRDTFVSLKQTCSKLSISFMEFLKDRIFKTNKIPSLSQIILEHSQQLCKS